jgi:hypothetical protein
MGRKKKPPLIASVTAHALRSTAAQLKSRRQSSLHQHQVNH